MASEPIRIDPDGTVHLKVNWKTALKVVIIALVTTGASFIPLPGLTTGSRLCLMIFVGAAGLWVTEAIPPFATAILVIGVSIYLLGRPGGPLGLDRAGANSYQIFLNPFASPVLILFFGGFILAIAAAKHGLDLRLAKAFIRPFGTRPAMVLLGVISTTALFSMFMSNTATTAMMFAIFLPIFERFETRGPFKKALVLAVPFAANIGGMGTLIGTPPNAVAASILSELGHPISFAKWMVIGVPVVVVLLAILWVVLLWLFHPKQETLEILFPEPLAVTWDLVTVSSTFALTVLLWITEPLHKIPSAVVVMLPVMVFTMFGIIDREDLKKIEWDVLLLVAGGLALGIAMKRSGLSDLLVTQIPFAALSVGVVAVLLIFFPVLISNFMSNTSAANLLIPIVTSISVIAPRSGALIVAFATSLAMSLPISTPPNAIAFSTRAVNTREMARVGTIISLIGALLMFGVFAMLGRLESWF